MPSGTWGHPTVILNIWSPCGAAVQVVQTNGQYYGPQLPTFSWDSGDVGWGFYPLCAVVLLW